MTFHIVAIALGGTYAFSTARHSYLGQMSRDLESRARLFASQATQWIAQGQTEQVDALCRQLAGEGTRITVVLPSGKVIGDSDESPRNMENHRDRPEIRQALGGEVGQSTRFSTTL